MDRSVPQERVLQGLISQNSLGEKLGISIEGKLRIRGRVGPRGTPTTSWILEAHPLVWKALRDKGRAYTWRTGSVACGNISRFHAVLCVKGTGTSRATALSAYCVVSAGTANTQEVNAPHVPQCAYPEQERESDVPTSPPGVSLTGRHSKLHIRRYPKINLLRILQHNCAGNRSVMDQLRQLAADQRVDILLLQEPYSVAGKVVGLLMVSKLIATQQGKPWAAIIVLNPLLSPIKLANSVHHTP